MLGKFFGIEIGNDTVKIAACSGKEVKSLTCKRMPENLVHEGQITNMAAMSSFLKETCKENGIHPGKCAFVLPREAVIAHKVKMPVMAASELELNLPFEFRDFVGRDSAKYYYDYVVQKTDGNVMELYAAAVSRDVVSSYESMLRAAGFSMRVAIPAEMALQNLISSTGNAEDQICIVDIGQRTTNVSIFAGGRYEMGRTIDEGGYAVDEVIAHENEVDVHIAQTWKKANMKNVQATESCSDVYADLAVEVMRVVGYYQSTATGGSALNDVYYCGGGSLIEAQRVAIVKRTDLTMHHIRRLMNVADDVDDDLIVQCALAAGAGIQAQ